MRRITTLAASMALLFTAAARAQTPRPRIVNGVFESDFPEVGALVSDDDFRPRELLCTGTLIGCSTFLVAAHCVCDEGGLNFADCGTDGVWDPSELSVFLPHAGLLPVKQVRVSPRFEFESAGDIAVITLDSVATAITPALLQPARIAFGTPAVIVGYGTTSEDAEDQGVKRSGSLVTGACPDQIGRDNHICWSYDTIVGDPGADSNTCYGDSGGPLFVGSGKNRRVAGVTSGGDPTCDPNSVSWNADVVPELTFIAETAGGDLATSACGNVPAVGSTAVVAKSYDDTLTRNQQLRRQLTVPKGVQTLRIALNGAERGTNSFGPPNDFDLFVNQGSAPEVGGTATCSDESIGTWAYCEIDQPAAGTWHILTYAANGQGPSQLTVTMIGTAEPCTGDCDGGGVTVDEIVRGINIALGNSPVSECGAFDPDASGDVTVEEIIQAINNALSGCSN